MIANKMFATGAGTNAADIYTKILSSANWSIGANTQFVRVILSGAGGGETTGAAGGPTVGASGAAGADPNKGGPCGQGGGGGASAVVANGGAGGKGGLGSGGGGGGGARLTYATGAGGLGGDGYAVILEW